jgi:hypothetical protein
MGNDVAFDEPIMVNLVESPIRTVGQAAEIVRSHLRSQFTIQLLNILLVLERAAEGLEIAQARHAFFYWASTELGDTCARDVTTSTAVSSA